MKKMFISFMALAAMAAGLVSCNSKAGQYHVAIEPFENVSEYLPQGDAVATWDNALECTELSVTEVTENGNVIIQMPENLKTDGVRRLIHPASVYAGEDMVSVPTVQSGTFCVHDVPVYAETVDGSDVLKFMPICGVLRLHLTTPEKIASITVSTADSLGYMSGLFHVNDYPNVNLVVDESLSAVNCVRCESLPSIDFTQGADVCFIVAPGTFKTFTVTMTTPDGRVCVKNTKEDMAISVERAKSTTVNIGSEDHELVFE